MVQMGTKELALQLAKSGYGVIPCYPRMHERAKAPMTEHGQKDASKHDTMILRWFGSPHAEKLIGIPCKANGFFAVDIDGPEGAKTWGKWIKEFGLSEPGPWQKTARGSHYLFKYPDFDFTGAVGKVGSGIDLRADNYICTGGKGSGYEWQIPLADNLTSAPGWLLEKIKSIARDTTRERSEPSPVSPLNPDLTAAYWLQHYARRAEVGKRNEAAYKMGQQLFYAGIPLESALELWSAWSEAIPHDRSNPFTQFEYMRTIKSAYSGDRKAPALLPAEAVKPGPKQAEKTPQESKKPEKPETVSVTIPAENESEKTAEFSTWADLDDVFSELTWDWEGWMACGYLHILVGMTGEGKSRLALRIAETYIMGTPWPDGTPYEGTPGAVLWCEAEAGQKMNWDRAMAAGLPREKFYSPFTDPTVDFRLSNSNHMGRLAALAIMPEVKLIVVDSLSGADPRSEKSTEDARSVNWLAALARDINKPILVTHHLRKRGLFDIGSEVNLDRLRGASAIAQYARVIWAIDTPDSNDVEAKRLSVIKSNLARRPEPVGFTINDVIEFMDAPEPPRIETSTDRAVDLLLATLAKGPALSAVVEAEFEGAAISRRAMYSAKNALSIVTFKKGKSWYWSLPAKEGGNT